MSGSHRFLMIRGYDDDYWHNVIKESLSSLGELQVEKEERAMRLVMSQQYDLVIIDSSAIRNVPLLIARVRAQRPHTRVVVATASPEWDEARDAFQAGATDYINKSYDKKELEAAIKKVLDSHPEPVNEMEV